MNRFNNNANAHTRSPSTFSLSNLLSDPFALSTISICTVGWVLALVGSITSSRHLAKFPVFTWWGLAFQVLVILMTFHVSCTNNVNPYRLVLLAALSTTTIYTTNSTNNFVYLSSSSTAAAAAGFILLSIINITWMFYYGTTEEVRLHALVDSFASNKPAAAAYGSASQQVDYMTAGQNAAFRPSRNMSTRTNNGMPSAYRQGNAFPGVNENMQDVSGYNQSFLAAPLGAFENSSTLNKNAYQQQQQQQTPFGNNNNHGSMDSDKLAGGYPGHDSLATTADSVAPVTTPTVYPYRARAVYSYTANPADANEISFDKGEVLEVSDISGKWWQARRENGQVGICPSNYVVLEKEF